MSSGTGLDGPSMNLLISKDTAINKETATSKSKKIKTKDNQKKRPVKKILSL